MGISLIEILTVIALIGIISTFAYPAYRKYVVKAEVARLYANGLAIQAMIVDEFIEDGRSDFDGMDYELEHEDADYITVTDGIIEMNSKSHMIGDYSGKSVSIVLTPSYNNGLISWECSTRSSHHHEYLPKQCQNDTQSTETSSTTESTEEDDSGGKTK